MNIVTPERCGWRDEWISLRHRQWGVSCPAVDLDFVMLEFNYCEPIMIVEYKHIRAPLDNENLQKGRYRSIRNMCDGYHRLKNGCYVHDPLPFIVARYNDKDASFMVIPINDPADKYYCDCRETVLTERQYVEKLLLLRMRFLSDKEKMVLSTLNNTISDPLFSIDGVFP